MACGVVKSLFLKRVTQHTQLTTIKTFRNKAVADRHAICFYEETRTFTAHFY